MPTPKGSIRNVMDANYGVVTNTSLSASLINSSLRLALIDNIASANTVTYHAFNSVDPQNPTTLEFQTAAGFTLEFLEDASFGGTLPDSHNINFDFSTTPSTLGFSLGIGSNIPNNGDGVGFMHHYHSAQFATAVNQFIDDPNLHNYGNTSAVFAGGGGFGGAGAFTGGTYKLADLAFDDFRHYSQYAPVVTTTSTGWAGVFGQAFAEFLLTDSASGTGYPHFDIEDEIINTAGPISIGGYADGLFTPGTTIDPQYI